MRLIGLDMGDKRTGVATGSDDVGLATPVGVLEAPVGERLTAQILVAIDEHGADRIVIGLPLNMDGTEGPRAKLVREFAATLAERTSIPIELQDERLSSYEADRRMARSGLTHKQKKSRRDALAAAAMLQDYLERGRANTAVDDTTTDRAPLEASDSDDD